MDLQAYLGRLRCAAPHKRDAAALAALHLAHLQTIPFENLDIHLDRPISLELPALFDKIVRQGRGGFCYELNGLFAAGLQALGFGVTHLAASDAHYDGTFGPEFDHLALLVTCPGDPQRWLVDVGWGDTFQFPLHIDETVPQPQNGRSYRLDPLDGGYLLLWQCERDGTWERQYRLSLQPRRFPDDYLETCVFHQTSPRTIFTRKRICTLATPDGRVTLDQTRLIETGNGQRQETPAEDPEIYRQLLAEKFGIHLDAGAVQTMFARSEPTPA